jgi:hypothetical protein
MHEMDLQQIMRLRNSDKIITLAYEEAQNFRRLIYELAKIHREIQVDENIIRVTTPRK